MRTQTTRTLIGLLVAAAFLLGYATLILTRGRAPSANAAMDVVATTQMLKVAQTEKFQSDLQFAESNADAALLVGGQARLGRIGDAEPVVELNVRPGGVIEYLLDKKGSDGKPRRVIHLPDVGDPVGSRPITWRCYSANWPGVTGMWNQCSHDTSAWERERRHVDELRAATEKTERDAENSRARYEGDRARSEFERQRERRLREEERAREYEERQLSRIERETERARIEIEREKRGY